MNLLTKICKSDVSAWSEIPRSYRKIFLARTEVTSWMSGGRSSDGEMSGRPTFETQVPCPHGGILRPEEPARTIPGPSYRNPSLGG